MDRDAMSLFTIVILWAAFCIVHSGLISVTTTRFLQRRLGERFRWVRLFYNLFSLITLALLLIATSQVPGEQVFVWNGWLRMAQVILFVLGILCFVVGARNYDLRQFLGIDVFYRDARPKAEQSLSLATGLNALVRHPWYTGVFLLIWSNDLTTTELAVNSVLSAYLVIGTVLEERKLVQEYGQVYRKYQRDVSMFFPWRWLSRHLTRKAA